MPPAKHDDEAAESKVDALALSRIERLGDAVYRYRGSSP